jgi:hypothetical protein
MRIKIIGDNNCARATRHLLRLGGFAVTEFLPADAVTGGPLAGYAITIDLAPAPHTPSAHLRPDPPTHEHASGNEEAALLHRAASSPSSGEATVAGGAGASVHFDSVDSALEAAVLRHVTQLAAAPVIVDRPGGVVHSDRELRIVAPNTGDAAADEAAAVAIEFGVLRGLLDLSSAGSGKALAGAGDGGADHSRKNGARKNGAGKNRAGRWWPFGVLVLTAGLGILRAGLAAAPARVAVGELTAGGTPIHFKGSQSTAAVAIVTEGRRLKPTLLAAAALPQGQFVTGQGFKITDGTNFLVVDPCKAQVKAYASISQTANTQLLAGTVSKKIYVCSIHLVAAAATDVAVVEGTGTVCATGTAGVGGFGGATAATGWNFAANGGIALGNGDAALGAEGTSGDNLCVFNSGSGQVSGGISYVVE